MSKVTSLLKLAHERGVREATLRAIDYLGRPMGVSIGSYFMIPEDQGPKGVGHASVFNAIYEMNHWGSPESSSGVGSEHIFTENYRRQLVDLLRRLDCRSIFDVPCGDMNWMIEVLSEVSLNYVGGDISDIALAAARSRAPDLDLRKFDICHDEFPYSDVWHCRDCLFHLSFDDIKKALGQFLRADIPYALITTHRSKILKNNDIKTGGFRLLDLEKSPLKLPRAIEYLDDYRKGQDFPRFVGLWSRDHIAVALEKDRV